MTHALWIPIEIAMGVMKEFIISIFCWPIFPSENTDKSAETANPATNITSMVARLEDF